MVVDPNIVLDELLTLTREMEVWVESGEEPDEPAEYYRIAFEMADRFRALHEHLFAGHGKPDVWR